MEPLGKNFRICLLVELLLVLCFFLLYVHYWFLIKQMIPRLFNCLPYYP